MTTKTLAELIEWWRARAAYQRKAVDNTAAPEYRAGIADALSGCADELEAALSQPPAVDEAAIRNALVSAKHLDDGVCRVMALIRAAQNNAALHQGEQHEQ